MIAKAIAQVLLLAALLVVGVANYWYTFGLWPKSWLSMVVCFALTVLIVGLQAAVNHE